LSGLLLQVLKQTKRKPPLRGRLGDKPEVSMVVPSPVVDASAAGDRDGEPFGLSQRPVGNGELSTSFGDSRASLRSGKFWST